MKVNLLFFSKLLTHLLFASQRDKYLCCEKWLDFKKYFNNHSYTKGGLFSEVELTQRKKNFIALLLYPNISGEQTGYLCKAKGFFNPQIR